MTIFGVEDRKNIHAQLDKLLDDLSVGSHTILPLEELDMTVTLFCGGKDITRETNFSALTNPTDKTLWDEGDW